MLDKSLFIPGIVEKYPEELLENRLTTEGNVVGTILGDLTLLDDVVLQSSDFVTKDGRFLFGLCKTLREKHYTLIDEVTVLSNVNEEVKEKIDEIGGWKPIQHLIDVSDIKNWDAVLDNLNKSNVLFKLYSNGFNLFSKVKLDNGKEIAPLEMFEHWTSAEVIDWYESKLSGFGTVTSNKIIGDEIIDFDDAFIESLSKQENLGVSFGDAGYDVNGNKISTFPFMSSNILGLKRGTLSAFSGHSGTGKSTYMVGIILSLIERGEKVLIVNNEMGAKDIKTLFLVWLLSRYFNYWKLPKRKIMSGIFTEEDMLMIKRARELWKEKYASKVRVVTLSDADSPLTCQIIKKYILREGFTTFVVDTFKLDVSDNKNDAFWMKLIVDSRNLEAITKRYNIIGIITIQLAANSLNRLWMDSNCLSNSKGVKEILSNLIMMRKVFPEELTEGSPYYIHPFRSKQDEKTGEWIEEPYTADPTNVWRIMFIDKSRSGADSSDTGVAYLVRYNGDFCSFYETAKCRPTRKLMNTASN